MALKPRILGRQLLLRIAAFRLARCLSAPAVHLHFREPQFAGCSGNPDALRKRQGFPLELGGVALTRRARPSLPHICFTSLTQFIRLTRCLKIAGRFTAFGLVRQIRRHDRRYRQLGLRRHLAQRHAALPNFDRPLSSLIEYRQRKCACICLVHPLDGSEAARTFKYFIAGLTTPFHYRASAANFLHERLSTVDLLGVGGT